MNRRRFTRLLVLFAVILSLGTGARAGVSCKVEEMVFCKDIHEWQHRYQPLDRTTTFSPEDKYVYCFLKIHAEKATDVTVKWTTPSGELYYTHSYELEAPPRGHYTTWSLRPATRDKRDKGGYSCRDVEGPGLPLTRLRQDRGV